MELKNINTLSQPYKDQIGKLVDIWKKHLGEDLIGIYLHGSLAQQSFREGSSDIDVLMIVSRPIPRAERLKLAADIIDIDGSPAPLEMSALTLDAIVPWKRPAICQFHYSDYWTERYKKSIEDETAENYLLDNDFPDDDITSYIAMINKCGIVLYGRPIEEVFPEIPDDDFWRSITADIDDYDFDNYNPRYFSSNILILGRILSFKAAGKILSKYESSLWLCDYVPEKYRRIVSDAFGFWYNDVPFDRPDQILLDELRDFLVSEIKKY